jgi:hypothetical protein
MRKIMSLFANRKHSVRTITIISGVAAIAVFASGSLLTNHVATQQSITRQKQSQAAADKVLRQADISNAQTQKKDKAVAAAAKSDTKPADTPKKTATATNSSAVKYSTSSDPRSTAYSLTPPPANPASFNYKVTHAGQFAAGSPIYYNATKGEKGFYGGDLVLSPGSVTISRSGAHQANVTTSAPDGRVIAMATSPWDDHSPYMTISMDTDLYNGTGGEGTSLQMFVHMFSVPANGTYTLHITTGPVNAPTTDGWQYDGFITVHVVD